MRSDAKSRRERRGLETRRITYSKIVLAVFVESESIGFLCTASDADLAFSSGRCVKTVRHVIRDMEKRGIINILGCDHGFDGRVLVLLDREDGRNFAAKYRDPQATERIVRADPFVSRLR